MVRSVTIRTRSAELSFDEQSGAFTLVESGSGQRLLFTNAAYLFRPVLNGEPVDLELVSSVQTHPDGAIFTFRSSKVEDMVLRIDASQENDCLDISCTFSSKEPAQLNRLELFPAETILTPYDLVNFRNRHHTPATWPELLLGGDGFETDTYSKDWQFAPHPSMFIFRKLSTNMFFGALDLPKAFGMYLTVRENHVQTWHLDYGQSPHGQQLAPGEKFTSPRFRLFIRQDQSVYDTLDDFSSMLIRSGMIPDPRAKVRHQWWTEPLYCTWVDQGYGVGAHATESSEWQSEKEASPLDSAYFADPDAVSAINENMVRDAVSVIKRENLPFRTILLDDGWEAARGQWEPHPDRFPDLRGLVDELHENGFKVVVWWNWAEVAVNAEVDPRHLMAGGKLNAHGCRVRDYSIKSTQEEYLKPLFHKLFSSDPGCYDLDGVKTDFLADKVHAEIPQADPEWRGEENYFCHVTELFYNEMKRHKPDAVHIGCAGHFWLAEWMDINRTYDVCGSNYLVHEERSKMLRYTTPGCPVAYDFHACLENLDHYFASARKEGAAIQVGNLLYYLDDPYSEPRCANSRYYEALRKGFEEHRLTGSLLDDQVLVRSGIE